MDKPVCWTRVTVRIIAFLLILSAAFPLVALSADVDRFTENEDGTVTDNKTRLMWAAKDNGKDIDFEDAGDYCESFSAGGFTDWRLPDIEELKTLFEAKAKTADGFGITGKIRLSSCCPWSSYDSTGVSSLLDFRTGKEIWGYKRDTELLRALPVRRADQ